jgi:hypothetical protein
MLSAPLLSCLLLKGGTATLKLTMKLTMMIHRQML